MKKSKDPAAKWWLRQYEVRKKAIKERNDSKRADYWVCVIGPISKDRVPSGGDGPPRDAAEKAVCLMIPKKYRRKMQVFSGWGNTEAVAAHIETFVCSKAVQ